MCAPLSSIIRSSLKGKGDRMNQTTIEKTQKSHSVQFYEANNFLADSVSKFVVQGLQSGEGIIVIATPNFVSLLKQNLIPQIDFFTAIQNQQLIILDAQDTLNQFMIDDLPDKNLFTKIVGETLDKMAKSFPVIRAYGEMVNILWEKGNLSGTIALESLWNELLKSRKFSLLCGYSMENFKSRDDSTAFAEVCKSHTHVHAAESYSGETKEDKYQRLIAELQQKTMALQTEIAERRSIENELRKSETELQAAKEIAETASLAKSRFLANMSHEIRSPLTAILGFAELMKDPTLSFLQRTSYADTICRNGSQLSALVNDILDLSKVEAGHLDVELIPMSLASLIANVTSLFRPESEAKGLKLIVEELPKGFPERICSDPTRIHQILTNVIGNAIKFTSAGEIKITFKSIKNPDDQFFNIGIGVEDTGIGMNESQQRDVFLPFIQADSSTTRKYGGTGLGLALSKKLAQALGGDLVLLKAKQGEGSSFFINFPVVPATLSENKKADLEEDKSKEKNDEMPLKGIRVLLAEDSPDNQTLVKRYLNIEGAAVEIAQNGLEAVKKALEGDFHIILMDVMMPICDGYDATRRLRLLGYNKPIVTLTAHALSEERERSFAEGCNEHLTKPINRPLLVETIEKFVFKNNKNLDSLLM